MPFDSSLQTRPFCTALQLIQAPGLEDLHDAIGISLLRFRGKLDTDLVCAYERHSHLIFSNNGTNGCQSPHSQKYQALPPCYANQAHVKLKNGPRKFIQMWACLFIGA